jgi:hypothetical protein
MTERRSSPVDPDLTEHRLDLARPELAAIRERYAARTVLVVAPVKGDAAELEEEFLSRGWHVRTCAGPGRKSCPLMRAESCEARESCDVAVVHFGDVTAGAGVVPRLRCAADQAAPAVVVLEGRGDAVRTDGRRAVIGGLRSPSDIAAAADGLSSSPQ